MTRLACKDMTRREWLDWGIWAASLGALVLMGLVFVVVPLLAQPQEVFNERTRGALESLGREVDALRRIEADARLRLLESDVYEIKWVLRAIAGAFVGVLIQQGMARREAMRQRKLASEGAE